jgi:soluble lytic murein transglycosylase
VRLGARYLNALSERYHGQLPLVALAYNAGPQSLNRWLKASKAWRLPPSSGRKKTRKKTQGNVPLDLFVERVPFKEARAYVKRLLKTYAVYELLYGEQGPQALAHTLPLYLKTTPRSGVDF